MTKCGRIQRTCAKHRRMNRLLVLINMVMGGIVILIAFYGLYRSLG